MKLGVIGLVSLLVLAWIWYRLELRPLNSRQTTPTYFNVGAGESPGTLAEQLVRAHLIRSHWAFLIYVTLHGQRGHLQTGVYALAPAQGTGSIAMTIASGRVAIKRLVIPEGKTNNQIAQLVATVGITPASFRAALNDNYTGPAAALAVPGAGWEGLLFPDSYQVTPGTTAHQLIQKLLDNFDHRITPDLVSTWQAEGLTIYQALILASIVEREVATATDRAQVAQVFLSRLKLGMPLESDVTVEYAAAQTGQAFSTAINSPYNTYRFVGLPLGPICNPGLSALLAVAHPATTHYLYFVTGHNGKTYYAQTYAEHQRNIQLHL